MNSEYLARFEPDQFYHIYNRSNDDVWLYEKDWHYDFFLNKYKLYLNDYVDTFAYCLLKNHFHLLIKCNPSENIKERLKFKPSLSKLENLFLNDYHPDIYSQVLVNQFARLFTSYAMVRNKASERRGNLFYRPFKRKAIQNENHFTYLIYYIHKNGIKHRLMKNCDDYPWCSYRDIITNSKSFIKSDKVIEWFGSKQKYIEFHQQEHIWHLDR